MVNVSDSMAGRFRYSVIIDDAVTESDLSEGRNIGSRGAKFWPGNVYTLSR